jgi:hypothetical protein
LPVEILSNHVQIFVGHAEPGLKKASVVNDPPNPGFVTWGTPVLDTTYSGENRGNTGIYASKQSSTHTYNHLVPLTDGRRDAISPSTASDEFTRTRRRPRAAPPAAPRRAAARPPDSARHF